MRRTRTGMRQAQMLICVCLLTLVGWHTSPVGAAPTPVAVVCPASDPNAPPGPCETPIDLTTVLELTGASNPTIGVAAEAVAASQADLMQARALLLPTLDAGMNFNLHRGNLQSSAGSSATSMPAMYAGFGAYAVGSGTVTIPGIRLVVPLADALFEPRAARYQVTARQFDAVATRTTSLTATLTYFDLLGPEAGLACSAPIAGRVQQEVARLTPTRLRRPGTPVRRRPRRQPGPSPGDAATADVRDRRDGR